jgi:hypothetical protein
MLAIAFLSQEAGEGSIDWMVWVALLIFAAMVALGWLVSSRGWLKKEEEPVYGEPGHEHSQEETHSVHDVPAHEKGDDHD